MSLEHDLDRIALQERQLRFQSFDADSAWRLGTRIREIASSRNLAVAIDIQVNRAPLFFSTMVATSADLVEWIRRKRNVVDRYHRSSYAVGLELERKGMTLTQETGADARDYATHGGCFPITLTGTGCIGTVTVSGLPQRADHALVVEAITEFLGYSLADLALDPPSH